MNQIKSAILLASEVEVVNCVKDISIVIQLQPRQTWFGVIIFEKTLTNHDYLNLSSYQNM
ncbi:hypothetical protein HF325_003887 [Metschnikowia pulcherrima]|uniref:Uncharacterized protein n=1 Tax=Metschnikowia pulcherrima TaxID=27326 RepID=A0A8H7GRZ4_9ASCO|nr:hypothetical protein HF325_003887 [Metschnikowia pulcherrima]